MALGMGVFFFGILMICVGVESRHLNKCEKLCHKIREECKERCALGPLLPVEYLEQICEKHCSPSYGPCLKTCDQVFGPPDVPVLEDLPARRLRGDTSPDKMNIRFKDEEILKPAILATGICAQSPNLPCCKETIDTYKILSQPVIPADIEYPDCRSDGYYAAKQCQWFGCYCVDPNGNSGPPTQPGDFNIICPGLAQKMPKHAK